MSKRSGKLHIAYLVSASIKDSNGGMRVIFEHVNRLMERGHAVEIWVPPGGESVKPYFQTSVPIKGFSESQLSDLKTVVVMTDPVFLPQVSSIRNGENTYLFIQHDVEMVFLAADMPEYAYLIRNYREYLSNQCQILTVSKWVQNILMEKYGLSSHLIRNGVDTELFHPSELLIQSDDPLLLTFYDPQKWKGYNEAGLAMLEAKKSVPNARIAIIGRSFPETPKVKGMQFGYPFSVIFFNTPLQNDLAKIYSSASVFVSASWHEGFGLPGLEAMACGTPVVTTDSGGVREYAVPNETAIVTPAKDIDALATQILKVLKDTKLQSRLRANGLKKARELSWDKSINNLEQILN